MSGSGSATASARWRDFVAATWSGLGGSDGSLGATTGGAVVGR